jgi:tetratricopeptide (TPR) repeat protein
MNKFKVLAVVLFLISFKTFACLNGETKTLKNGVMVYVDFRGLVPHGHRFYIENFTKLISELDSLYKKTNNIDYLSDKGYVLIVQKKYEEALKLYRNIEKIKPNRYSTASNLGTLYELMGENQKAYQWIKKSIEINPESHNGSEWLHLRILEAKIKKMKNVSGEFLINTDFGDSVVPQTKLSKKELETLSKAVYYQVNERMSFIKPKDEIISVLLFELGNMVRIIGEKENAIRIYNLSKEYGFQNELINSRLIFYHQNVFKFYEKENIRLYNLIDKIKKSKEGVYIEQVNQMNIALIILSIVALVLLIALLILYFKWKKLKDYIILNDFTKQD